MEIQERILEISQATNPNGRRKVKFALHEIYPDRTHWNRNGITYLEQYTRDNADSVKGMPLCAEFLDDDKDVPYGHGLTGHIKNMPVFEDSVQVGSFEDWSIEDIEIDGEIHRCLCATGYINEGRYPKFVKWIEDQFANGKKLRGSVEFVGTKDNDGEIIYDGGWKEQGRIPMIYDYSGYCILSIKPSDPSAILIELNQKRVDADDFDVFGSSEYTIDMQTEAIACEKNSYNMGKSEYDNLISQNILYEERLRDDKEIEFNDIFE